MSSLQRYIEEPSTATYHWRRDIDHRYQLLMIAERQEQIVEFHRAAFRLDIATADILARSTIAQERSAQALGGIERSAIWSAHYLGFLPGISRGIRDGERAVYHLASVTEAGFERLAAILLDGQETVERIARTLQTSYETRSLELRRESDKWLRQGMKREPGDPDRADHYEDAYALLNLCVQNPIGRQDYSAWFNIGWLNWRHRNDLAEAENAFNRARRLSEPSGDAFYLLSVRHLAQMQYLQGRPTDARRTSIALRSIDDADGLYDAARFAARSGDGEWLTLLRRSILLQPLKIRMMHDEADFASVGDDLRELESKMTHGARTAANSAAEAWSKTLQQITGAMSTADAIPKIADEAGATGCAKVLGLLKDPEDVDYLAAIDLIVRARTSTKVSIRAAQEVLARRDAEISQLIVSKTWGRVDWFDGTGFVLCLVLVGVLGCPGGSGVWEATGSLWGALLAFLVVPIVVTAAICLAINSVVETHNRGLDKLREPIERAAGELKSLGIVIPSKSPV
jgi:tetratricopeptide (TPR) repeat protein